jgi:Raf kinase inhibitor-like YbhB/YbcL family protein
MMCRSLLLATLVMLCAALGAADTPPAPATLSISSATWKEGQPIPMASAFHGWGLDGGNASPDLGWTGKPAGTKSLALTVFDPDAPTGIGFWHWVCFNIPGSADGVPAGAGAADQKLGPWINGLTDYGKVGYNGPCPPKGDKPHHYIVTVYALDIDKLDLGSDTTPAMLKFFLRDHVLAQGTLTGTFQR